MHWPTTRNPIAADRRITSATIVANSTTAPAHWNRIASYTPERWRMCATPAAKPSATKVNWKSIRGVTAARNLIVASIARNHLRIARVCWRTPLCTRDARDFCAKDVAADFRASRIYKPIEDRIRVRAVSCLSLRNPSTGARMPKQCPIQRRNQIRTPHATRVLNRLKL